MTTIRVGLRLPEDINKDLEKAAKEQYVSKNTLAIHIFKNWLKEQKKPPAD